MQIPQQQQQQQQMTSIDQQAVLSILGLIFGVLCLIYGGRGFEPAWGE